MARILDSPLSDSSTPKGCVRVGDVDIAWEECGEGERPLLLVHGYTGSRDDWREQLPRLGALGRTLAVDQRGHGESTNTGDPGGYSFDQLVSDLAGVLDALGVDRCDLLGHSLGGMVALRLALQHSERVASLVLMDTAPGPISLMPKALREAGARMVREHGMSALAGIVRRGSADPKRPRAAVRCEKEMGSDLFWERIETKLRQMDPEAFIALAELLGNHAPVSARLAEIRCPTLVVVGEEDERFLAPAEELAAGVPGARQITIAAAAHSPQLESPDAWFDAIRCHLQRARG